MQPILPNWCRNAIAILLVFIFCGISLSWQSHVKVPERSGDYLGVYKIPEFKGAERHTYNSEYINKVWYVVKTDKYEEYIGLARFLRTSGLPDMTFFDIKRIANLRKNLFYKLAKEKPTLFDPIDRYVVYPEKQINCEGYTTEEQTHHERKISSLKVFEFVQEGENYALSQSITFNDATIQGNSKLQMMLHGTWQKVINGLSDSCGGRNVQPKA